MTDLLAGMNIADRLNALERKFDAYVIDHELAPGAHAAAFAAHNMSPGPVEEAEEVAQEIVENAEEIAEVPAEAAADAVEEAPEVTEDTIDELTDAVEELTDAVEDAAPVEATTPHEDVSAAEEGPAEREPRREHPLHKKISFGG